MTRTDRGIALVAAISATAVEVYCIYDGLKNATGAQLAMGILFAVLTPLTAAFMRGALKYFGILVFVVLLAGVIVNSGSRVGGAIDRAQDQRLQAFSASKVATDTATELKGLLDDARGLAKKACADGKERTSACTKANARVDDLVGQWADAASKLSTAPVVAGDGDIARVSAWLGGYATDRQVSLYLPLLLPVGTALAGAFFWAVWGHGRPTKTAPAIAPAIPAEILAPTKPQLVSDRPPAYSVADYIAERIVATKGGRLAFPKFVAITNPSHGIAVCRS
jgi:hypothetical protein